MNRSLKASLSILSMVSVALMLGATAWADGPARQRPLSDFLETQGSQSIYIPPVADY